MRGVIPASSTATIKNQKEKEAMQYIVESSHLAGDAYQLDEQDLKAMNDYVSEMETINVLELNAATFKYPTGLTQILKDCEDPFQKDIANLVFQQNPAEPTKLIKALDLFNAKPGSN